VRKLKVLHVVGAMNRAGVETWLLHLARARRREEFDFDFLVHSNERFAYSDDLAEAGCRILPCLYHTNLVRHALAFFRLVSRNGPYDVLHSHMQHFDGVMAFLGKLAGIPMIISHGHSDSRDADRGATQYRRFYFRASRWSTLAFAAKLAAVSDSAGQSRFGSGWRDRPNSIVSPSGIDTSPFASISPDLRVKLGLPASATVIGHVGRFEEPKNHRFLLEIARATVDMDKSALFLFVGQGSLLDEIRAAVVSRGLSEHVRFLGERDDVPLLMTSVFDAFIFPSIREGLGMVAVEAQAAGLPAVISSGVPPEADICSELIRRVPLQCSAEQWARTLLDAARSRPIDRAAALQKVKSSRYDVSNQVAALEELYRSARPAGAAHQAGLSYLRP